VPLKTLPESEVGDDLRQAYETREAAHRYHSSLAAFDLTTPLESVSAEGEKSAKVLSAAMIHIDARQTLAAIKARSSQMVYLQVAMILVGTLFIYLAFRRFILKPLASINQALQEFSGGDKTARATIFRKDEIGNLAQSLNDVTQALARTQTNFEAVFNNAPLGISINDRNGPFVEVNPELQAMFGYTEEEFIGRPFLELVHPNEAAFAWGMFQGLMTGERDRYQIEVNCPRKDGTMVLMWVSVSAIRDPNIGLYSIAILED